MGQLPFANKSLGQHFLRSESAIKAITSPVPTNCDAIVEVGPGPAILTPYLAAHGLPLYLLEMDGRFEEKLTLHTPRENIFFGDALKFPWDDFTQKYDHKNIWLVSNLPYNVSVPLTLSFFQRPNIATLTLMYQKEVAEKFLPKNLHNEMNSLHVLASLWFQVSRRCDVPPGAFVPPPKVMSQVLHFSRKSQSTIPLNQWDKVEHFLRSSFAFRRKQLFGILKQSVPETKLAEVFRALEIPPTIRAEALSLQQVVQLYEKLSSHF